jgi:hypothetical protein
MADTYPETPASIGRANAISAIDSYQAGDFPLLFDAVDAHRVNVVDTLREYGFHAAADKDAAMGAFERELKRMGKGAEQMDAAIDAVGDKLSLIARELREREESARLDLKELREHIKQFHRACKSGDGAWFRDHKHITAAEETLLAEVGVSFDCDVELE